MVCANATGAVFSDVSYKVEMMRTVFEHESHLFSWEEVTCLQKYSELSCMSQLQYSLCLVADWRNRPRPISLCSLMAAQG
jgi:hypothetical protein